MKLEAMIVRGRGWLARGLRVGALLLAGAASAAAPPPPEPAMVLVRLANGETVTVGDFSAYLATRADLGPLARTSYWAAEKALHEQVMTRVLVLEGERTGVERSSARLPERFDDIYGLTVFKRLAPACEPPADAAATRAYYDAHPEAFQMPPSVRTARVMLPASERIDDLSAMAWLTAQAQAVAGQQATFGSVVDRATQAYQLETQGDVGWVLLEGDAPLVRALAAAHKGDMVGPLSEGGYAYLFLVTDKHEARLLEWREVERGAATRAVAFCRAQARQDVRERLFRQYEVVFDEAALRQATRLASRAAPAGSDAGDAKPAAEVPQPQPGQ